MKRKLLLSALLLISSAPIIAQDVSNTATKTTTPDQTTASIPIIKPVLSETQVIDRKIAAVDAKLAYYSSHPDEKKIAESDGTIASLEKEKSALVARKSQTTTKPNPPAPQMSAGKTAPVETVEHLNSVILAIDHKVEFIKNDQTENQHAIESGWYDKMAQKRADLVEKRDNLIKEQATK